MRNHLKVSALFFMLGASVVSCAQQTTINPVINVSEVRAHPFEWSGKTINLQGFIEVERTADPVAPLAVPMLFASRKDAAAAYINPSAGLIKKVIDLSPATKSIDRRLKSFRQVACVVLRGEFKAYRGMFMGIGNYVSDTGIITVTGIRKCDKKKLSKAE